MQATWPSAPPMRPGRPGATRPMPRRTRRAAGDAVMEGGRAADAAVETMDVKTALMADTRVDAGDINVDTDHTSKTVTLKGRVPTAEQKAIAEQVAKDKAAGYQVRNELMVGKG